MNTEEDTNLQSLITIFMMMLGPGQDPVEGVIKQILSPVLLLREFML